MGVTASGEPVVAYFSPLAETLHVASRVNGQWIVRDVAANLQTWSVSLIPDDNWLAVSENYAGDVLLFRER